MISKNVNMILLWTGFAFGFWLIDASIDFIIFEKGLLLDQLISPTTGKLIFRSLIGIIFITIGVYLHLNTPVANKSSANLGGSDAILQNIIDNIPQLIFWKNTDLEFLGCNQKFAESIGLKSPSEVIGKTDYEIVSNPKDADFFRESDIRVMETKNPEIHSNRMEVRENGEEAWQDLSRIPLIDTKGNVIGVLGTSEDITERKNIEDEKLNLSETLRYRVKELTSLYSIDRIIEENKKLNVPLAKISSIMVNALRFPEKAWIKINVGAEKHTVNEHNISEGQLISGELNVLGNIVGSIEVGYADEIPTVKEEVELVMAVSGRISRLIENLELQEKSLEKERYESTQKLAAAVAHEISQPLQSLTIISDLAKNNWKENSHLLENIPDHLKRISTLVEKMLNLTSVETMDYAGGLEIVDINKSAGTIKAGVKNVLIIDDNDAVLKLLVEVIKTQGISAKSASNGSDGLEFIKNNKYDLIMCDIKLPDIDGLEIFQKVEKDLIDTPFIFMSGYVVGKENMEIINRSAGFLKKPFSVDNVIDILKSI